MSRRNDRRRDDGIPKVLRGACQVTFPLTVDVPVSDGTLEGDVSEMYWACQSGGRGRWRVHFKYSVNEIIRRYPTLNLTQVFRLARKHQPRLEGHVCKVCKTPFVFKSKAEFARRLKAYAGRLGTATCQSCKRRQI
jgi:hypothetical protein